MKLLGVAVEDIHHLAEVAHGLQGRLVRLIGRGVVKQDEHALPLIQDSWERRGERLKKG